MNVICDKEKNKQTNKTKQIKQKNMKGYNQICYLFCHFHEIFYLKSEKKKKAKHISNVIEFDESLNENVRK